MTCTLRLGYTSGIPWGTGCVPSDEEDVASTSATLLASLECQLPGGPQGLGAGGGGVLSAMADLDTCTVSQAVPQGWVGCTHTKGEGGGGALGRGLHESQTSTRQALMNIHRCST
jgi:hypothetical protein